LGKRCFFALFPFNRARRL